MQSDSIQTIYSDPERPQSKKKRNHIAIYILLFFAAWFARVLIFLVFDRGLDTEILRTLSSFVFRMLIWVVPVFLYLHYVDKTSFLPYLKLTTNLKTALLASIGVILLGFVWQALLLAVGADQIGNGITPGGLFNGVIVPSINEEILLRGFILNKLKEITAFWKANIITSLLFVAIHWPGWTLISKDELNWMLQTSLNIFLLSLVLGYFMKKINSLWPSITGHAVNNLISIS